MKDNLYFYKAKIVSVYDGDTCRADIDLGLHIWLRNERLRLARINAPERRGPEKEEGLVSADFLRNLINGKEVIIETQKDKAGKYGRYIAEIWLPAGDDTYMNVNDHLVEKGYAEYKEY